MPEFAAVFAAVESSREKYRMLDSVTNRSRVVEILLVGATCMAFLDEGVRKTIPGQPIYATAPKDALLLLAGLLIWFQRSQELSRYVVWFVA